MVIFQVTGRAWVSQPEFRGGEQNPRWPVQAGHSSEGADGAAAEPNAQALGRAFETDLRAVLLGNTAVRNRPGSRSCGSHTRRPRCAQRGTLGTNTVLQRGLSVPLAGLNEDLHLGGRHRPGWPEAEKGHL